MTETTAYIKVTWFRMKIMSYKIEPERDKTNPEDHWSCIAHLIAEDMLNSAVIEETTFKHSPWAGQTTH